MHAGFMKSTAPPEAASNSAHSATVHLPHHGHKWGALTVGYVDRAGGSRYELIVFPPGTTDEQRRALLFRRQWLPWGAVMWFLLSSGLSTIINGWAAVGIGAAVYVAVLVAANAQAGASVRDTLTVRAQMLNLMGHRESFGDYELLEQATSPLLRIDEMALEGRLDAVEYELRWAAVYNDIVEQQQTAS